MIEKIELEYQALKDQVAKTLDQEKKEELRRAIKAKLKEGKSQLQAHDYVYLARLTNRPKADDYVQRLFDDIVYLSGDRLFGDDPCLVGGIASYKGRPISFLATKKGKTLQENLKCNFGMPNPEGYRKARRLMDQANKFGRPLIHFIDTSGAYPGIGAEERGQGEAIAQCIMNSFNLQVPILSVVTGEGGSGGALALGVGNDLIMFEFAVYSVVSPEGFASIVWKNQKRAKDASQLLKVRAQDLLDLGVADFLIPEDLAFDPDDFEENYIRLDQVLEDRLNYWDQKSPEEIQEARIEKFRRMGQKWD